MPKFVDDILKEFEAEMSRSIMCGDSGAFQSTSTVSNAKTNESVLKLEMLTELFGLLPKLVDEPKRIWYHHDTWKIMSEFVEKIQPDPSMWMTPGIPMHESLAVPFGFVYIEMSSGKVKILDLRKKENADGN